MISDEVTKVWNHHFHHLLSGGTNLPLKKAKEKITEEGLRVGNIREVYQPNLIPNTVIEQGYPANLKVTAPIKIDLDVSKNKK